MTWEELKGKTILRVAVELDQYRNVGDVRLGFSDGTKIYVHASGDERGFRLELHEEPGADPYPNGSRDDSRAIDAEFTEL
jgi:hypothetical protein